MADLVFLGAGASRPFGIPTMQEMVTEFENGIKETEPGLFDYYVGIKKTLVDTFGSFSIDIEAMLSVIEGIAKRTSAKDLGHYALYYISKIGKEKEFDSKEKELAEKLLGKLKEYIKNSCTVNLTKSKINETYEKSYLPLFRVVKGTKYRTFFGKYNLALDWKAYTTNYDDVFEKIWNRLERPEDHFDQQEKSDNYVFNTNRLALGNHSFVKLHGSLDWTLNKETGDIVRKKTDGYEPYETGGDVMLFPIQQKDLYLHPWYALFSDFKQGLMTCSKWYVVGYAFNDEFIREAFTEQLKLRKEPTLIIIDPSAKQQISKFPQEVRDKIIPLPIKFGSDYFSRQIMDFNEGVRTLIIKVLTDSHMVGFKSSIPITSGRVTKIDDATKNMAMKSHSSNEFIEVNFDNADYKEIEMELKFQHAPPFDKDLELQIFVEGVYDYEFTVYFEDRRLRSGKGNTSTQGSGTHYHYGKSVKIYHDSLFVSF